MERTFKGDRGDLLELLDGAEEIGSLPWRHGRRVVLVFEHDGRHWRTTVDVHPEEGWQLYGEIVCTEVRAVQKTVTAWEDAP